jgi:hypothetical protein
MRRLIGLPQQQQGWLISSMLLLLNSAIRCSAMLSAHVPRWQWGNPHSSSIPDTVGLSCQTPQQQGYSLDLKKLFYCNGFTAFLPLNNRCCVNLDLEPVPTGE